MVYPKQNKCNVPLRPILSMVGLVWQVPEGYMTNYVKDSFTFVNYMQNCPFSAEDMFMCSFDISRLFTCVPLPKNLLIFVLMLCTVLSTYS